MDERDVFVSRIRHELEDKEEENRMLQVRLEIMRQENERAINELTEVREELEEVKKHYEEIRDNYASLMDRIMKLKDSLSR